MNLDSLIEGLPHALRGLLPVDRIAVALLDHAGNVVAERAVSTAAKVRLDVGFTQALSDSSLRLAVQNGHARVIDDLAALVQPSVATRLILEEGLRSSLTVPIYHHYVIQLIMAETSRGFVRSMEKKDSETGFHIERMSRYAHAIASALARDPEFAQALKPRVLREILWFAPLHDIGKIGIPDAILFKPGPLTPPERTVMETHVEMGASIFRELNSHLDSGEHHQRTPRALGWGRLSPR